MLLSEIQAITDLLATGNLIKAVKQLRECKGLTIKDAMDYLRPYLPHDRPDYADSPWFYQDAGDRFFGDHYIQSMNNDDQESVLNPESEVEISPPSRPYARMKFEDWFNLGRDRGYFDLMAHVKAV